MNCSEYSSRRRDGLFRYARHMEHENIGPAVVCLFQVCFKHPDLLKQAREACVAKRDQHLMATAAANAKAKAAAAANAKAAAASAASHKQQQLGGGMSTVTFRAGPVVPRNSPTPAILGSSKMIPSTSRLSSVPPLPPPPPPQELQFNNPMPSVSNIPNLGK